MSRCIIVPLVAFSSGRALAVVPARGNACCETVEVLNPRERGDGAARRSELRCCIRALFQRVKVANVLHAKFVCCVGFEDFGQRGKSASCSTITSMFDPFSARFPILVMEPSAGTLPIDSGRVAGEVAHREVGGLGARRCCATSDSGCPTSGNTRTIRFPYNGHSARSSNIIDPSGQCCR